MTVDNLTLRVQVDMNKDGDFDDANEDITQYVQSASWFIGSHKPFQKVADESKATVVISNENEQFSPGFGSGISPIPPHSALRISARVGATETYVTLWTGWIDSLQINTEPYTNTTVIINCVGIKKFWARQEVSIPLLINVKPREALLAILSRAEIPAAVRAGWTLGVTSTLDVNTVLQDTAIAFDLNEGINTLPYVGDFLDRWASVWDAITAVVMSDYGRFWISREGKAVYRDRLWLVDSPAPFGGVSFKDPGAPNHTFGETMVNDITVNFTLRKVSATAGEVLWELDKPVTLSGSKPRRFTARYAGAAGEQISGMEVQQPSGADFVHGGSASITFFQADSRSAEIEVSCSGVSTVLEKLVVRGRKITTMNSQAVKVVDDARAAEFGRREMQITLPFVEDIDFARNVAEYELATLGLQQSAEMKTLTLYPQQEADHATLVRVMDLYTRIRVTETYVNYDVNNHIIGEQHEWRDAGKRWETTLFLERGVRWPGMQLAPGSPRAQLDNAQARLRL